MTTASATTPARKRVLVVDDHPFFREGLAAWLGRQGGLEYCGCADTVRSALAAIEQVNPDLVLLDLQLREGDGFDVLRACRDSGRSLRVIVVSQKDEMIFAERTLRAGAHGYVAKDEASDTLSAAIQTVFGGGLHVSPGLRRHVLGSRPDASGSLPEKLSGLYNRELEVLELLGRGRTTKEIAHDMNISPKTVESYRESLKKKLGLPDGLALVRFATVWQQQGKRPD